ncbi:hypothetical protein MNV49_003183 [Pseudohyphozyma bogoriensis]|nr:hypothetical protein MNV49_003183 [Pseudohyphozyma bogoriensis]
MVRVPVVSLASSSSSEDLDKHDAKLVSSLVASFSSSKNVVALVGAGISTSACIPWDEEVNDKFGSGETTDCPGCVEFSMLRTLSGKRSLPLRSFIRPNILLYDESPKPSLTTLIHEVSNTDLDAIDFMLVMGTSLKIPGFKMLVKEFGKEVGGRVAGKKGGVRRVLVDLGEGVGEGKEWEGVFDLIVRAKTDDFVDLVMREWKWNKQGTLAFASSKLGAAPTTKPSQPPSAPRSPFLDTTNLPPLPMPFAFPASTKPLPQTPRKLAE